MKTKYLLILFPFLTLSQLLKAVEIKEGDITKIEDSLSVRSLESIVVSATKIRISSAKIPVNINLVSREELDRRASLSVLPVVAASTPGLFLTQKGVMGYGVSDGSAGVVNIRVVVQGNKVLIMTDGMPQWAGLFGHALPDMYQESNLERVEVIKGPASLIYGSNAMGGVVNFITKRESSDGIGGEISLLYGTYNTRRINGSAHIKKGGFWTFASVNNGASEGHRDNSNFRSTNGYLKSGYDFGKLIKVGADLNLSKIYNENPGKVGDPVFDNKMNLFRGNASLWMENSLTKDGGAARLYYGWGNHKINDGYKSGGTPKDYLFRSFDSNMGMMLYQSFSLFKGGVITTGLDFKRWGGHARNQKDSGTNIELVDKSVREVALYGVVSQDFLKVLTLNAGIRLERNSLFGNEWIPQVGLSWRAGVESVVKLMISKGFRSPNIREMYMFPPQNPNLKPESMVNYEVSYTGSFFDGSLYGQAALFFAKGSDLIEVIFANGRPKNENTGSFINKGAELQLEYRVLKNMRVSAGYSFLKCSRPIIAAPKHRGGFEFVYLPGNFGITVTAEMVNDLYLASSGDRRESYSLLGGVLSYRFVNKKSSTESLKIFVEAQNITGADYSINDGFPMPGAVVTLGLLFPFNGSRWF